MPPKTPTNSPDAMKSSPPSPQSSTPSDPQALPFPPCMPYHLIPDSEGGDSEDYLFELYGTNDESTLATQDNVPPEFETRLAKLKRKYPHLQSARPLRTNPSPLSPRHGWKWLVTYRERVKELRSLIEDPDFHPKDEDELQSIHSAISHHQGFDLDDMCDATTVFYSVDGGVTEANRGRRSGWGGIVTRYPWLFRNIQQPSSSRAKL